MMFSTDSEKQNSLANLNERYHFHSQIVFSIENEPLAFCVAGDNLLVANVAHCVEVRNLECHGRCSHTFCTVDLVKQILYSEVGQYVATLEIKTSRHSLMTHVRLYFNWQVDTKGLPMRARIAGRVTPSSQSAVGQLEMVELPLQKQACYIACCNSTGNLAVSCGFSVSIFHFCIKVHDISKLHFHDLEHLMEIYFTFAVKEMALCEEFLACMSANEVYVIRIDFHSTASLRLENKGGLRRFSKEIATGTPSPLKADTYKPGDLQNESVDYKDDSHYISWNGSLAARQNSPEDAELLLEIKEKLSPDSWPLTIRLPSLNQQAVYIDQSNFPTERVGPMDFFPGHPVKVDYTSVFNLINTSSSQQYDTTSLLYKRFSLPLPNSSDQHFCLHSLQLLPFYVPDMKQEDDFGVVFQGAALQTTLSSSGNPFHSHRRHHLKDLEVFFSSPTEGYLYSLLGEVRKVSSYSYGSQVLCALLENTILHTISSNGVSTHSLGRWERILRHFGISQDVKETLWSPPESNIVTLGHHPFFNVRLSSFHNGHLVLLTSSTDVSPTSESWTVYALQCPLVEEFYQDLIFKCDVPTAENNGLMDHVDDHDIQLYLEHEVQAVLAFEVLLNRPPLSSHISQLFQEACCRLGNSYLFSEDNRVSAAVFFYKVSNFSLECILKKLFTDCKHIDKRVCRLLSFIFIEEDFPTVVTLSKETANSVINAFVSIDSSKIGLLVLKGRLKGYDPDLALEHIQTSFINRNCTVEDTIATCMLYAQCGLIDKIPMTVAIITNQSLISATKKFPNVWLSSSSETCTFSVLLQVLQQIQPTVFVKILNELIVDNHIPSDMVSLLCQVDWDDYGLATRTDTIMLLFLEEILTSKVLERSYYIEAVLALISLYLKYLGSSDAKNVLPVQMKPWSLFGPRHSWLNDLPPFFGNSFNSPCKALIESIGSTDSDVEKTESSFHLTTYEPCPCSSCNDCLLRIQSLLCSHLASVEVHCRVMSAVAKSPLLPGALSLQILCSSTESAATELLISQFPTVLLEYCRDVFGIKSSLWNQLLNTLLEKVEHEDLNNEMKHTVNTNINGVVAYLAEILSPTELVIMLPVGANDRFVPYVKRCIAKNQAKQLKDIIITKGYELKALV